MKKLGLFSTFGAAVALSFSFSACDKEYPYVREDRDSISQSLKITELEGVDSVVRVEDIRTRFTYKYLETMGEAPPWELARRVEPSEPSSLVHQDESPAQSDILECLEEENIVPSSWVMLDIRNMREEYPRALNIVLGGQCYVPARALEDMRDSLKMPDLEKAVDLSYSATFMIGSNRAIVVGPTLSNGTHWDSQAVGVNHCYPPYPYDTLLVTNPSVLSEKFLEPRDFEKHALSNETVIRPGLGSMPTSLYWNRGNRRLPVMFEVARYLYGQEPFAVDLSEACMIPNRMRDRFSVLQENGSFVSLSKVYRPSCGPSSGPKYGLIRINE